MSRVGLRPITIPEGVTVTVENNAVRVGGPKGEQSVLLPQAITVAQKDNTLEVIRTGEGGAVKALHGTVRSLLANSISGVTAGFQKTVEIKGVGFRAQLVGENLTLTLGFTHPVQIHKPQDISFAVKGSKITISGINKQRVGEVAAQLRHVKPPDAYKGKGIRYEGEMVKLKPGKAVKTAGGTGAA
ncbi:50S ribosomal protein L6 [Candidatus Roizmanbacteria bacterium]|nr:50S ribosomal protein L6 [Candidatus Roizmanbacteria bacterium]